MSPWIQSRPRSLLAGTSVIALTLTLVVTTEGFAESKAPAQTQPAAQSIAAASDQSKVVRAKVPALRTAAVMGNLVNPWDVGVLPSGAWLVTERDRGRITLRRASGARKVVVKRIPGFWASGETGLMSIVVDPNAATNRRFYTCTGVRTSTGPQIRVYPWKLSPRYKVAKRGAALLTGIQIESGRHGGCRLRFDSRGWLYVGTGDSAVSANPQNLRSLNGKVLRLNRMTGRPSPDNPWARSPYKKKRYIYTFGHRNVQGLAFRATDGRMWSVEHGTNRDDEINRLVAGGNYGWDPGPGYNENSPMTELSLPGRQIRAKWRSGSPTIATSGAVWVKGAKWGAYQGTLAVCALKGSKLIFMKFSRTGKLLWTRTPGVMNGDYGRLRSVVQDSRNNLLVTTSNGANDRIVRVSPR